MKNAIRSFRFSKERKSVGNAGELMMSVIWIEKLRVPTAHTRSGLGLSTNRSNNNVPAHIPCLFESAIITLSHHSRIDFLFIFKIDGKLDVLETQFFVS